MSKTPSYLGLLNAISIGESEAGVFLTAWAETTEDDAVREVLEFVALREAEHGLAFQKRIVELGFALRPAGKSDLKKKVRTAQSKKSDKKKFEAFNLGSQPIDGKDVFAKMFANPDIDPVTGSLLGRYIAEERDSGRRLKACYDSLK